METFDIYSNGSRPLQGWTTYISTTTRSTISVYETPHSRLPRIEFKRKFDDFGEPTHNWWMFLGKGVSAFRAGLLPAEQVAALLNTQPKSASVHVSDPSF